MKQDAGGRESLATVPDGGMVPVEPTARTVAFVQVSTAAVPGAECHDIGIGQRYGTAARDIAERIRFQWLVVISTPLEIVDGGGGTRVVAVTSGVQSSSAPTAVEAGL